MNNQHYFIYLIVTTFWTNVTLLQNDCYAVVVYGCIYLSDCYNDMKSDYSERLSINAYIPSSVGSFSDIG